MGDLLVHDKLLNGQCDGLHVVIAVQDVLRLAGCLVLLRLVNRALAHILRVNLVSRRAQFVKELILREVDVTDTERTGSGLSVADMVAGRRIHAGTIGGDPSGPVVLLQMFTDVHRLKIAILGYTYTTLRPAP